MVLQEDQICFPSSLAYTVKPVNFAQLSIGKNLTHLSGTMMVKTKSLHNCHQQLPEGKDVHYHTLVRKIGT